jgi:hypothetical protein
VEAVEASLVYLGAQYGAVITKSDDRAAEKRALAAPSPAVPVTAPPADAGATGENLAAEGRLYRGELRGEILRIAGCLECRRDAEMLLEAMGDAPATRLREVLDEYRRRFDKWLPPLDAALAEPAPPQDRGGTRARWRIPACLPE